VKNNKIQFLLTFFIALFSFNTFGIDYFSLSRIELKDGSYQGGVEVGEMSSKKLKKFFNNDLTIIYIKRHNNKVQKKIKKVKLTNKIYTFDEAGNIDEEHIGVYLTRVLAIRPEYKKQSFELVAIPGKYKVEDVKMLNLQKTEGKRDLYLKSVEKNEGGALSSTAIRGILSRKKYFSIYKDSENPKFAVSQELLFLDGKPMFYNYHAFSAILSDNDIKSFLLKIDGKLFFLASFPLSLKKDGQTKKMDSYYYLVDLEKGKAYLPMHLREEK
jgi:hypothetical protein